tara:strand:+ start:9042 stop:9611 length:570 start_codon:yes stop_codon:yes gene_type:complete
MPIPPSLEDIELPEGYIFEEDSISVGNPGSMMTLNIGLDIHSFADYDREFNGILSQYLKDNPNIRLVDVGGGYLPLAVQEMMQKFPGISATNIDLLVDDGPISKRGDAADLPLEDGSVDALVSFRSIAYYFTSRLSKAQKIADEFQRVLKPGSHIFISPGVDLSIWSERLKAIPGMYGKRTYGKVYQKT